MSITNSNSITRLITRNIWSKVIWSKVISNINGVSMIDLNIICDGVFVKTADIIFDPTTKSNNTLHAIPCDIYDWNQKTAKLYTIVNDGEVVRIAGTQNGMKDLLTSSCRCELCNEEQRGTTLYNTIGSNLLVGGSWEFFSWKIPPTTVKNDFIGRSIDIRTQTYHKYLERVNMMYKKISGGSSPYLNDIYHPK